MANGHGGPRPGAGRRDGSKNKLGTVREAFERVFHALQEDEQANLTSWAQRNPTEFYKLSSKLIPAEISAQVDGTMQVIVATGVPADDNGVDDLV